MEGGSKGTVAFPLRSPIHCRLDNGLVMSSTDVDVIHKRTVSLDVHLRCARPLSFGVNIEPDESIRWSENSYVVEQCIMYFAQELCSVLFRYFL